MQDNAYSTELNNLHRRESYHKVWYFGDESELYSYFPKAPCTMPFNDDMQQIAVQMALADYQKQNPKGYAWLVEFYLGDEITQAELGRKYGISQQAVSERLRRYTKQFSKIAFMYFHQLI